MTNVDTQVMLGYRLTVACMCVLSVANIAAADGLPATKAFFLEDCILQRVERQITSTPNETVTQESMLSGIGAIIADQAPALIERSLDVFSFFLAQRDAGLSASTQAVAVTDLYRNGTSLGLKPILKPHCLVVARGAFGTRTSGPISNTDHDLALSSNEAENEAAVRTRLGLLGRPELYLELMFHQFDSGRYVALEPGALIYNATAAVDPGSDAKWIIVHVALERNGTIFASLPLAIPGPTPIGARLDLDNLRGLVTPAFPLPPPVLITDATGSLQDFDRTTVTAIVTVAETEEPTGLPSLIAAALRGAPEVHAATRHPADSLAQPPGPIERAQ